MPSRDSPRITAPALADILGLLDVVGEHVYVALAFPDGRIDELFQGPGADRLLGGAEPDPEMENWEAAIHDDDRAAYEEFNRRLCAGEAADLEYRLRGADGITRWVHDRGATRRLADGSVEISGIVSDVTERRRMRAELDAAHAALSRVVAAMDDHLYTLRVEPSGRVVPVYSGPHRQALIGGALPKGEAGDRLWLSRLHPDDRRIRRAALKRLPHGEPLEVEYRVVGLDGVVRIVHDRLRPRREPDGLYYDGVARDITERRELEAQLRRSAHTDALTGASNRRHFAEVVEARLASAAGGCGLLLIDADHFKRVNDEHGHRVGDAVLVELVRRLHAGAGPGDLLARWGGEEFALLLEDVDDDAELRRRAEALRAAVAAAPVVADGVAVRVTVSIGAVRAGAPAATLDALVEAADRRLYAAKRAGRDRVALGTGEPAGDAPAGALAFAEDHAGRHRAQRTATMS